MKLHEFVQQIEHAIPLDWALPQDPVGLQIGDPEQEVKKVYVGLEIATEFVKKAIQKKADLLLVHHPLIYRPLHSILASNPVQRFVSEIIRHNLSLYAAHTNMDLHPEGMGKVWAKKLRCKKAGPVAPKPQGKQLKLVTFVPADYTNTVRNALSDAGAGVIGEYDHCSYVVQGVGTFRGSDQTHPFTGQAGTFEYAQEDRLEMILSEHSKWAVVQALYKAHPYEEPAYELYMLDSFRDVKQALWIGEFEKSLTWNSFMQRVYQSLPRLQCHQELRVNRKRRIKRIALSTGSGSSMISIAARMEVDAYLTGEVGYHQQWEAKELGLNVVQVGHDFSESFFAETIIPLVQTKNDGLLWMKES